MPEAALIALEDGTTFRGEALTGDGTVGGEIVFTTAMTGYQEVATDPSYAGQLVTYTFPMVGNYGVAPALEESDTAHARAIVAREITSYGFSHAAEGTWLEWLAANDVMALTGVDTRALTRHIRDRGAMRAVASTRTGAVDELVELAKQVPPMSGRDLVRDVSRRDDEQLSPDASAGDDADAPHVVAYDFGIKLSIAARLRAEGLRLTVVPADTSSSAVLRMKPDGVFLSNGPGDPAAVKYAVKAVGKLLGKVPIFGICLGHQLLARALGLETYKLPFGHRGSNHPVRDVETGTIWITTQNHGFCVADDLSGTAADVRITHIDLNDGTVEGVACDRLHVSSVQFHPEAAPGPHDAHGLFRRFRETIDEVRGVPAAAKGGG